MPGVILFDRDQVEHPESVVDRPRRLSGSQLLWADLSRGEAADELAEAFELDSRTRTYLEAPHDRPVFQDFGRYIHLTAYAPREGEDEGELQPVECVVGQNWVLTAHDRPIPVLEEFAERYRSRMTASSIGSDRTMCTSTGPTLTPLLRRAERPSIGFSR